jgi:hypothetical protein
MSKPCSQYEHNEEERAAQNQGGQRLNRIPSSHHGIDNADGDLLNENDQDLYQWVSGQAPCPPRISEMIEDIQAFIAQARG